MTPIGTLLVGVALIGTIHLKPALARTEDVILEGEFLLVMEGTENLKSILSQTNGIVLYEREIGRETYCHLFSEVLDIQELSKIPGVIVVEENRRFINKLPLEIGKATEPSRKSFLQSQSLKNI